MSSVHKQMNKVGGNKSEFSGARKETKNHLPLSTVFFPIKRKYQISDFVQQWH